jgi:hypothetical protein
MHVKVLKVKFGIDFRLTQLEIGDCLKGIKIKLLSAVAASNLRKKQLYIAVLWRVLKIDE